MEPGDAVEWSPPNDPDILFLGNVESIDEQTDVAVVVEAHAFHRVWGASNGGRGTEHLIPCEELSPATHYKHIAKQWPADKSRAWGKKHNATPR